ncbi:helix-turn-helix transcriptional regulator [Burkholderia cenocepacia]|uniref:helix-turn-helix domain-containing protein n=1 Tax=Burkholderia cenocepacia TaxID=95486 RepID=UPI001B9AAB97|nr:helix-turn-helix transcriptional regulator [Burkholderia cenocepacia]
MALSKQEELVNRKIGKTIAKKRKAAGFTQEQVAERLGIGNEAFSRIERGLVSPGIFKLYELADLFGCGVETFLIEGSRRSTDQAEHLERLVSKLSAPDRQLIVGIVERLSLRLAKESRSDSESLI